MRVAVVNSAFARNYKKFGLVPRSSPKKSEILSRTAVIIDHCADYRYTTATTTVAYFDCSEEFETAIGSILPQGIGPHCPAFITVERLKSKWWVKVSYLEKRDTEYIIFVYSSFPEWLHYAIGE